MFRDLPGEAGSRFFQEIIVVENQGHGVQVVEALNIVNIGSDGICFEYTQSRRQPDYFSGLTMNCITFVTTWKRLRWAVS